MTAATNIDRHVTLHHAPQTRSFGILALLLELDADHDVHVLNLKSGEHRQSAYLAINPMGKVPALQHLGALVSEQAAIYLYLGDLYADRGLAPQMGDPLRGPLLRWLVFYGSCFEPALMDKSQKREPAPQGMNPYGTFDAMLNTLTQQLSQGPWMLGERFTVADMLWGSALQWTTAFGLVEATPLIQAYIDRVSSRPSVVRAAELDQQWLAARA